MSEQLAPIGWAILELMGHIRLAGYVTEEERFGSKVGRIDIPGPDGASVTQYFGGGSIYRLTPTTEQVARSVALHNEPEPVHRWELPAPRGDGQYRCVICGRYTAGEPNGHCMECEEEMQAEGGDDPELDF